MKKKTTMESIFIYREDKFSGSKLLGTIGNEDERWHYRALTPFTNDATATIASSKGCFIMS